MVNKVILVGNLTRDVELKTTPSGKMVASVGLATNKSWKDGNGVKQDKASFHNLTIWGKGAEILAQYTKKGSKLYVEGEIEYHDWETTEGEREKKNT